MQRSCPLGVAGRVGCVGLGLNQIGARLRKVGLNTLGREHSQHLPGANHVSDVGIYLCQAQANGFSPDDGLLPRSNGAVGGQLD